ncbi:hypothetical protein BGZ76_006079, partial [Entomortierella beljakovae]
MSVPHLTYSKEVVQRGGTKRWYKESMLDISDEDIASLPFSYTKNQRNAGDTQSVPNQMYMGDMLKVFTSISVVSKEDLKDVSKKRRYAELSTLTKQLLDILNTNPDRFQSTRRKIQDAIKEGQGASIIHDPTNVKSK